MANRTCVGCGKRLTGNVISREHILPQWLAQEVEQPDLSLKHYLHNEDQAGEKLLRAHSLGSFAVKNVCTFCNNGWMSQLEVHAKPVILGLMHMQTSLLQLQAGDRAILSAWAIKTAFMLSSVQPGIPELPWHLFCQLAEEPENIPIECFVLATQLPFLPNGFLYACPTDFLSPSEQLVQVRIGLSFHHLHLVVIIPLVPGDRMVRASGVHIPIWPLEVEILVRYANFPTITSAKDLISFLTGLVNAGLVTGHPAITSLAVESQDA